MFASYATSFIQIISATKYSYSRIYGDYGVKFYTTVQNGVVRQCVHFTAEDVISRQF